MSTAPQRIPLSVADYLGGEPDAEVRHEYVDGRVYAMAGGTVAHNRVATRTLIMLGQQLDQYECEVFNSDTKIRIREGSKTYFYYPDAMIVCDSNSDADTFQDKPVVIVEVLSNSTRRVDEGEKRDRYLMIESLQTYILLESDRPAATIWQRDATGDFEESLAAGADETICLVDDSVTLNLGQLFRWQ